MPVERRYMSISQFCELADVDPKRFMCVENGIEGKGRCDWTPGVVIVLEPEDDVTQVKGTFPQLNTGGKKIGGKKGGKRGC